MNGPVPAASVAGEGNGRQGPPADGDVVIDMRKVATRFGAHVVVFLCSPKSRAINGDAIAVGGGAPRSIHY